MLDALARTQAYACTIGDESGVLVLRELPGGALELIAGIPGAVRGAQVTREEDRIVLLHGTDYFQIDGTNSFGIENGRMIQATCADLSPQFYQAVILALGDEGAAALSAMQSSLAGRRQGANAEADTLQAELDECRDRVQGTLPIVQSFLETSAGAELPPSARENYARLNTERVQAVIDACTMDSMPEVVAEAPPEIVTEAEEPGGAVELARRPPARPSRRVSDVPAYPSAPLPVQPAPSMLADPGAPMTEEERDAFRVAVDACWDVASLSSEAKQTIVTVVFELDRDGRVAGEIELLASRGGTGAAVSSAFEMARRAVLRCQGEGFPLPPEKYEQWRLVEMSFDPIRMAIR
jgi:hypothetical protein